MSKRVFTSKTPCTSAPSPEHAYLSKEILILPLTFQKGCPCCKAHNQELAGPNGDKDLSTPCTYFNLPHALAIPFPILPHFFFHDALRGIQQIKTIESHSLFSCQMVEEATLNTLHPQKDTSLPIKNF